jgi:hypothetical protein
MDNDFWFILVMDVGTIHMLENLVLLGYYVVSSGNFLLMFRDKVSVPSSGFKNPRESL